MSLKKYTISALAFSLVLYLLLEKSGVARNSMGSFFENMTLGKLSDLSFVVFTPLICFGGLLVARYTKNHVELTTQMILENREQTKQEQDRTDKQLKQIKNEFKHQLESEYQTRQLRIYVDDNISGKSKDDLFELSVNLINFGGTVCIRNIRTIGGSNESILLLDDGGVNYRENRIWEEKTKRRIIFYVPQEYKEVHELIITYSTSTEPHMEYVFQIRPNSMAKNYSYLASHLLSLGDSRKAMEDSPVIEQDKNKTLCSLGHREGDSYSINKNSLNY